MGVRSGESSVLPQDLRQSVLEWHLVHHGERPGGHGGAGRVLVGSTTGLVRIDRCNCVCAGGTLDH